MEKEFELQVDRQDGEWHIKDLPIVVDGEWHIKDFPIVMEKVQKYVEPFFNVKVDIENRLDVKKDLASLRKLSKALNDKRIAEERKYLEPFNTYKNETKEIVETLDKAISYLDKGVKAIDEEVNAIKEEIAKGKQKAFIDIFNALGEDWLNWEDIKEEVGDCEMDFAKEKIEMIVSAKKTIMATLDEDTKVAYLLSGTDLNKALLLGQQMKIAKKRLLKYIAF